MFKVAVNIRTSMGLRIDPANRPTVTEFSSPISVESISKELSRLTNIPSLKSFAFLISSLS